MRYNVKTVGSHLKKKAKAGFSLGGILRAERNCFCLLISLVDLIRKDRKNPFSFTAQNAPEIKVISKFLQQPVKKYFVFFVPNSCNNLL